MRINNNLMAMNAHRQLSINNDSVAKSLEKLSSGYRINRAGDDAAGLAISEKMRGQIRGLNMASKNAQDDISLIQTAEGALNETHSILQRMRELAVQSANDTNVSVDRQALQAEVDQLSSEITRISQDTEFNTQKLLDNSFQDKVFHIGANQDQHIKLSIADMGGKSIGVEQEYTVSGVALKNTADTTVARFVNVGETIGTAGATATVAGYYEARGASGSAASTVLFRATDRAYTATTTLGVNIYSQTKADESITTINNAIEKVSSERSKLGAFQNRLEHTIKNLDNVSENVQSAESRIRDVDMAKEMMEFTKQNILSQAANAMLAQANQAPQTVLQLLK
jgi:flagellin